MSAGSSIGCAILASGLSLRYGPHDKLMANYQNKPLLTHILHTVQSVKFTHRFVVTPRSDPRARLAHMAGFEIIDNPAPSAGLGASLALAIQCAQHLHLEAVCIVLGDMPFISADYLESLSSKSQAHDILFSRVGQRKQVPAIFRSSTFNRLAKLTGDQGARQIDLGNLDIGFMDLPVTMARDFDRREDFDVLAPASQASRTRSGLPDTHPAKSRS